MNKITLDHNDYNLKLDFDAVEYLEEQYDVSILSLMDNIDMKQKDFVYLITGMTKNTHQLTESDVKQLLKNMAENGDFDYVDMMTPITQAFKESVYVKKIVEQQDKMQKKKMGNPSE